MRLRRCDTVRAVAAASAPCRRRCTPKASLGVPLPAWSRTSVAAVNHERRQVSKRVSWKEPNIAWAIDATERGQDENGTRLYVHAVQDLCTRYRFTPLVAVESKGEAVAAHPSKASLGRHGAPLFLKRDNGSPLNHAAVDRVLAENGVIPLNSPAYYPKYNGAVEKGIRDLKDAPR